MNDSAIIKTLMRTINNKSQVNLTKLLGQMCSYIAKRSIIDVGQGPEYASEYQ